MSSSPAPAPRAGIAASASFVRVSSTSNLGRRTQRKEGVEQGRRHRAARRRSTWTFFALTRASRACSRVPPPAPKRASSDFLFCRRWRSPLVGANGASFSAIFSWCLGRALVLVLLARGGVEQNPGPSDDEEEQMEIPGGRFADDFADTGVENAVADPRGGDKSDDRIPSWEDLAEGTFRVEPVALVCAAVDLLEREPPSEDLDDEAPQRLEQAIEITTDRLWRRACAPAVAMKLAAPVLENVLWAAKNNHFRKKFPWCFALLRLVVSRWAAEGLDGRFAEEALGVSNLVCDALSRRCVPEPLPIHVAPLLCGGLCSRFAGRALDETVPACGGEYLSSVRAPAETTSTTESHSNDSENFKNTDLSCVVAGVSKGVVRKPRGGRRAK